MIVIKNSSEIDLMRKSGELLAELLLILQDAVQPGISTAELDAIAEKFIAGHDAYPTFKGYAGFPAAIIKTLQKSIEYGVVL